MKIHPQMQNNHESKRYAPCCCAQSITLETLTVGSIVARQSFNLTLPLTPTVSKLALTPDIIAVAQAPESPT